MSSPLPEFVRHAEHFAVERRNGVLLLRLHTGGGPAVMSLGPHRALKRAARLLYSGATIAATLGMVNEVVPDPAIAAARLGTGHRDHDRAPRHPPAHPNRRPAPLPTPPGRRPGHLTRSDTHHSEET